MYQDPPNPINSLVVLLEKSMAQGDKNQPVRVALSIGMDSNNSDLANEVLSFYRLLDEVKDSLRKLGKIHDQSDNLRLIETLTHKFISTHIWKTAWNDIYVFIKAGNYLTALKNCSTIYKLSFPRKNLDKNRLEKIATDFRSIIKEVKESDLPENLKFFVIRHLEEVISVINQYEVYGIEKINSAIESSLGSLVFNPIIDDNARKNNVFKRVFVSLRVAAEIIFASIGVAANVDGYLVPRLHDIKTEILEVKPIISSEDEVSKLLEAQVEAIEPKLLPPAEDESEDESEQVQ